MKFIGLESKNSGERLVNLENVELINVEDITLSGATVYAVCFHLVSGGTVHCHYETEEEAHAKLAFFSEVVKHLSSIP